MDPTSRAATATASVATRPRWPYVGHGQQTLLWASILITVGAFLPWLMTSLGTFGGMRGAGSWTVFALPLWQVGHLLGMVGLQGWLPGIGLLMTLAGGVALVRAALELHAGD